MFLGAIVLVLLFVVGYSYWRKRQREGLVLFQAGLDLPGNDIVSMSDVKMSDCWTDCSNNSSCVAMVGSVGSFEGTGTCWLKSSFPEESSINSERFSWFKNSYGLPESGMKPLQCSTDPNGQVYLMDGSKNVYPYGSSDIMKSWFQESSGVMLDCEASGLNIQKTPLQTYSATDNWSTQVDTDYPNDGNIGSLQTTSAEDCKYRCAMISGCNTVTFDGTTCNVKNGTVTTAVSKPGTNAYMINPIPGPPPASPVWADASGVDFPGNDFGVGSAASPDDCRAPCEDSSGCVGFMYDASGQTCTFKSAMSASVAAPGAQSFFLNPVMSWSIQPGTDFPGNDSLGNLTNTTPQACQAVCSTAPGCKGIVFDNNEQKCYIKTSMTTGSNPATGLDGYIMTPAAVVAGTTAADVADDAILTTNRPLFRYFLKKKYGDGTV
jgi:hypothetical protein